MKNNKKTNYYAKSAKELPFWPRLLVVVVGALVKLLYRPQYHNTHYIPQIETLQESYMIVANHSSILDPVFIHLSIPNHVHWVAKKELFKAKSLKKILQSLGAIPLDRDNVDIRAMKDIRNNLKNNKIIGLFPQGTRVEPDRYEELMAQAGVAAICLYYKTTVLPVYTDAPYKLLRKNNIYFGPAFCLNPNLGDISKNEKNQILSNELVRRCYHIANKSYFD